MDISNAVNSLAALSQETRLSVFRLLIQAGEQGMAAGEISERLGVRQNTMSANLTVLLNAGLVKRKRDGRSIIYSAELVQMQQLIAFMLEDCCGGRPEKCRPLLEQVITTNFGTGDKQMRKDDKAK